MPVFIGGKRSRVEEFDRYGKMLPLESKREKVDIFPGCFEFLCQFSKKCSMFDFFLQYYALDALSRGKRSALFSESSRA